MDKLYKVYKSRRNGKKVPCRCVFMTKFYDIALDKAAFWALSCPYSLYSVWEVDIYTFDETFCQSFCV